MEANGVHEPGRTMIPAAAASLVPLLSTYDVTGPELGSGSRVGRRGGVTVGAETDSLPWEAA